MAVASAQVAVSTTAVSLAAADPAAQRVTVKNGAIEIFLGPSGVTAANGCSLAAAATLQLEMTGDEALFAIAAAGSSTVGVLRTGTG